MTVHIPVNVIPPFLYTYFLYILCCHLPSRNLYLNHHQMAAGACLELFKALNPKKENCSFDSVKDNNKYDLLVLFFTVILLYVFCADFVLLPQM